jgi:hypothetical protein
MKVCALFRYQTLTVPEEDAANCLFVNGTLIHISSTQASESVQVHLFIVVTIMKLCGLIQNWHIFFNQFADREMNFCSCSKSG